MPLNTQTCPVAVFASFGPKIVNEVGSVNISAVEDDLKKDLGSSVILAGCLLAAALFLLFAGAKLVKPTVFLAGFGVAFLAGILGANALNTGVTSMSDTASCVLLGTLPLVLGLLVGLLALKLLKLGFFALGAGAGVGVGYVVYMLGLNNVQSLAVGSQDLIFVLCLVICGLVGGCLMLKYDKELMILTTSAVGAAASAPALALLLAHADARFLTEASNMHTPYGWAQPATALLLFVIGLAVQCRYKDPKKRTRPAVRDLDNPLIAH